MSPSDEGRLSPAGRDVAEGDREGGGGGEPEGFDGGIVVFRRLQSPSQLRCQPPLHKGAFFRLCEHRGKHLTSPQVPTIGRLYKKILCPLHNLFPYPLFLCRCRRKEKAIKKKRHANIPAANILTLLPAAGARKGGFLKKAPFKSPKNLSAADAMLSLCAPN